jgi:hypothetical protein
MEVSGQGRLLIVDGGAASVANGLTVANGGAYFGLLPSNREEDGETAAAVRSEGKKAVVQIESKDPGFAGASIFDIRAVAGSKKKDSENLAAAPDHPDDPFKLIRASVDEVPVFEVSSNGRTTVGSGGLQVRYPHPNPHPES